MAQSELRWNLTYNRFVKIVSKELSGDFYSSFIELLGNGQSQIEYSLDHLFNDRTGISRQDKIDILVTMTRIFRDYNRTFRSDIELFVIAGCVRLPEAFEIWSNSTDEIRTSEDLYSFKRAKNPRAFLTYLKLLKMLNFNHAYAIKFYVSSSDYRLHLLESLDDPKEMLNMDPVSSEMNLHLAKSKFFDSFADMSSVIVTLLQMIYGRQKVEQVVFNLIKSDVKIYPDDLITVIENWEEFSKYPIVWTTEVLLLDTL